MSRPRFTPPQPRQPQHRGYNPVRAAVAVADQKVLTTNLRVLCALASEGDQLPDLLADVAFIVGIGAEIAFALDSHSLQTRKLHSTLRCLVEMGANQAKWNSHYALNVSDALDESMELGMRHGGMGLKLSHGASLLAGEIRKGSISLDAVAGGEIYKEERAAA